MEGRRPMTAERPMEERKAVSLMERMMQYRRASSGSGFRSQEGESTEKRIHNSMYHTTADEARMHRLDQLLSRLGTLAEDAQPERSQDPGGSRPGESNNRCTELVNQFCGLETLFKEHIQKDLTRAQLPKNSSQQLPRRQDHEQQSARPKLVEKPQEKKPAVASNISVDTRLENAIEQLMDATKNHLLDKKLEVQRLEDTSERALKELDTVKSHEEELLRKRFSYLEQQYRERAAQLEEEFALRTAELRQSAVAQITAFKQKSENAVLAKVESLLLELNGMKSAKSGGTGKVLAAASYLQSRLRQIDDSTPYFNHEGLYCSRSHDPSIDGDAGEGGWCGSAPSVAKGARRPPDSTVHRDPNVETAPDMEEVISRTHSALEDRLKAPKTQLKASKLLFRPLRVSFGPSRTDDFQGEDLHVETISPLSKSAIVLPLQQRNESEPVGVGHPLPAGPPRARSNV